MIWDDAIRELESQLRRGEDITDGQFYAVVSYALGGPDDKIRAVSSLRRKHGFTGPLRQTAPDGGLQ